MKNYIIPNSNNNYHPYLLRERFLSLTVILIIISNILFSALGLVSINAYVDFNSIYNLQNIERTKNSLSDLIVNPLLVESATQKAQAMLLSDCWSHYCPDGKSPWDFFDNVGYDYIYAGENLGEGFSENEALMSAWMNSPTHRENILNNKFTEVGIGFAKGNYQGINNNTIIVVHFGTSVSQPNVTVTPKIDKNPEITPMASLDETPPTVVFDNFSMNLISINGNEQYSVIFTNTDVESFIVLDNFESQKIGRNSWDISIPKGNSQNVYSISTISKDLAGNETSFEIPFIQLLNKVKVVDVFDNNNQSNIFTNFTRGVSLNPKTNLNISMMIFLTGLFGIDFYILEKTGKTSISNSNRHVVLILIIISLILLIVTSASGQILDGLTFQKCQIKRKKCFLIYL